jgi:hypothetical protein
VPLLTLVRAHTYCRQFFFSFLYNPTPLAEKENFPPASSLRQVYNYIYVRSNPLSIILLLSFFILRSTQFREAAGNFEFVSFPLTVSESILKRAEKVDFVTSCHSVPPSPSSRPSPTLLPPIFQLPISFYNIASLSSRVHNPRIATQYYP